MTNNSRVWMYTRLPIAVGESDIFSFWTYYRIEEALDYAYVQVAADPWEETWTNIEGNITTNDNPNGLNQGNGITGNSGGWIQAQFDLSAYAGQSLYFAFNYATDESMVFEGIYLDDIGIRKYCFFKYHG